MPSTAIQHAAPSFRGKPPAELPHGLITPPTEVRQALEEERLKHPPGPFAREELGRLNCWTVDFFFDGLGHEVIYRESPEGPDVLAVGYEEVAAFKARVPFEERKELKTYFGY
jgi:hypothetical protein